MRISGSNGEWRGRHVEVQHTELSPAVRGLHQRAKLAVDQGGEHIAEGLVEGSAHRGPRIEIAVAAARRQSGVRRACFASIIGYVTLGTNELARASAFYDAVFAEMGAKRFETSEDFVYWGKRRGLGMVAVYRPHDGKPATVGNGGMVALAVRARDQVDRVHRTALSLGALDEGAPGSHGATFYGAYFRDLDGNKLCVFTYESGAPTAG